MDTIAKLAEWPALFAAFLALLPLVAWRHRQRSAFLLSALALGLYLAAAVPAAADGWLRLLEESAYASRPCPAPEGKSIVIVLAGGIAPGARSGDATLLSPASLRRTIAAAGLARNHRDTRFILSGGAGDPVREADLMKAFMVELGVAADRLVIERESKNTWENATAVARMQADAKDAATPTYLLTSAVHMPRALAAFRKAGVDACPVITDRRASAPGVPPRWIPTGEALLGTAAAAHEAIGLAVYAALGRI